MSTLNAALTDVAVTSSVGETTQYYDTTNANGHATP